MNKLAKVFKVWIGMHYYLIITLTKSGLFSKKCWIMQYPSLFQRGNGGLDKNNYGGQEALNISGSCSEKCVIFIRIQRTAILISTMRWP